MLSEFSLSSFWVLSEFSLSVLSVLSESSLSTLWVFSQYSLSVMFSPYSMSVMFSQYCLSAPWAEERRSWQREQTAEREMREAAALRELKEIEWQTDIVISWAPLRVKKCTKCTKYQSVRVRSGQGTRTRDSQVRWHVTARFRSGDRAEEEIYYTQLIITSTYVLSFVYTEIILRGHIPPIF